MNDTQVLEREKKSLYYINDSFKKIIITKDGLGVRRDEKGFVIVDIFDFLLDKNVLKY